MNRLEEARLAMGMRQTDLAQASGVSQSAISKMEGGEVNLTGTNLAAVARALGVSADFLLGLSDDPRPAKAEGEMTLREWAIIRLMRAGNIARAVYLLEGGDLNDLD